MLPRLATPAATDAPLAPAMPDIAETDIMWRELWAQDEGCEMQGCQESRICNARQRYGVLPTLLEDVDTVFILLE